MKYAIIVAGGQGIRMKNPMPKQFLILNGKPIICHTINAFLQAFPLIEIIVTLPKAHLEKQNLICNQIDMPHKIKFIEGGTTRFESVKNGLSILPKTKDAIVFIHDAVRPLIQKDLLMRCEKMASEQGNAVPVIDIKDSLRQIEGNTNKYANRNDFKIIQTPQTFQLSLIQQAFDVDYNESFTDDASVFEQAGFSIHLVAGSAENIKITEPSDLLFAEAFLRE
jgi:2-C-methyl-D-erythritol 4-phosphate cytidylyltransferase